MREHYDYGFFDKCAEFGLDPVKMAQFAEADDRERKRRRNRRVLLTALGVGGLGVAAYMNRGRIADVIRKIKPQTPDPAADPSFTPSRGDGPLPGTTGSDIGDQLAAGVPEHRPLDPGTERLARESYASRTAPGAGAYADVMRGPAVPGPSLAGIGLGGDESRSLAALNDRIRQHNTRFIAAN